MTSQIKQLSVTVMPSSHFMFKMSTGRYTSLKELAEVFHSAINGFLRQVMLQCYLSTRELFTALAAAYGKTPALPPNL